METSIHENELINVKCETDSIQTVSRERRRCCRCDSEFHLANTCRHKITTCSKCKKKGHLAKVCKGTGVASYSQHPNKTNLVRPVDEQAETLTHSCRCCSNVNLITAEDEIELIHTIRGADPYKILLDVNGEVIDFGIDTGVGRTILPAKVYREKSSHIPLERTEMILKTYSGEKLKVAGKVLVKITHGEKEIEHYIFVVDGNGPTLLGRDVLSKIQINWSSVYRIFTTDTSNRLSEVKSRYKGLVSEKLGKLTGFKAKIHVNDNATPKFFKPRQVAFSLQDAVNRELKRMEDDGI